MASASFLLVSSDIGGLLLAPSAIFLLVSSDLGPLALLASAILALASSVCLLPENPRDPVLPVAASDILLLDSSVTSLGCSSLCLATDSEILRLVTSVWLRPEKPPVGGVGSGRSGPSSSPSSSSSSRDDR